MIVTERLFGTDGVRGVAGVYPLDSETIERLGVALVRALPSQHAPLQLLIGRDTRESGTWIEAALARGVAVEGGRVVSAGVVPTPAIAFLTPALGFDAGVVISASHNPYQDNGIKVVSGRGEKLGEAVERRVEAIVADSLGGASAQAAARIERRELIEPYLAHVRPILAPYVGVLAGSRIVIDCGNGATAPVAPRLLREIGFDVIPIGCEPNGRNINEDSGSTHPAALARRVVAERARLGVAFDGDGDRAVFVDHTGGVVNGDAVLLIAASHMQASGRLRGNGVVATVMSNIGLEIALQRRGIRLVRCQVGDKYVTEAMAQHNLSLGGEQSGHIIFVEHLSVGDGFITALSVLRIMAETGRELNELAADLVAYPQVLVNVPVRGPRDLPDDGLVRVAMDRVRTALGDHGRLLVRFSGTERLLRVMIEGRDETQIRAWADEIAAAAQQELG